LTREGGADKAAPGALTAGTRSGTIPFGTARAVVARNRDPAKVTTGRVCVEMACVVPRVHAEGDRRDACATWAEARAATDSRGRHPEIGLPEPAGAARRGGGAGGGGARTRCGQGGAAVGGGESLLDR